MESSRTARACVVGMLFACLGVGACGTDATPPEQTMSGLGAAGTSSASFGNSACGACVASSCGPQVDACGQQPGCARRWDCIQACPALADGSVAPACTDACPQPAGMLDAATVLALESCIESAPCEACGASAPDTETPEVKRPPVAPNAGDGTTAPTSVGAAFLSQSCSPQSDADACYECELNRCCESMSACRSDAACTSYLLCMQGCGDSGGTRPTCVARCDAAGETNFATFTARVACVNARCGAECGGSGSPCAACVIDNCAESYVACQLDESCARLDICVSQCRDQACRDACAERFPAGVSTLTTYQLCLLRNNCPESC